ncbi:helix-turn-helix transcriptional regulator [Actinomyces ruminicola]|uniref:helix-turn-helix domain-containing protein n=1 Tax=Actinomyces ruminicola TaxID=332524 RepID=UPI0011C718A1|nr:helix-turn-helix transcriptional regulator [Actinomyces ruminicola]
MDLYELLDEDRNAPGHRHSRELKSAERRLFSDLVAARKAVGMSQADLARKMGTNQAAVSRFESGQTDVHLSTLRRYAKAVGLVIHHDVRPFRAASAAGAPEHEAAYTWKPASSQRGAFAR